MYGNADDPIRFACSKLAHIHCTTAQEYANNLLHIGEEEWRIVWSGNPSYVNIATTPHISRKELADFMNFDIAQNDYIVLLKHPLSSEVNDAYQQMSIAIESCAEFAKTHNLKVVGIYPNTDPGSYKILEAIAQGEAQYPHIKFFKTLPREIFINLIRHTLALAGNSSMGILEAPFYKLPVVNIGNRQKGRLNAGNVKFVTHNRQEILSALQKACFDESYRHFVRSLLKQNSAKDILVIATHPDDETLGAGGTLLKHKANGDRIHCIFCTDVFEEEGFSQKVIQKREQEIAAVCQAYGFSSVHRLGLKTMKVDEYPKSKIINAFSGIFKQIEPNVIYLPFAYDVHSDHRVIFESAFACTKSFRYPSIERVLMMETLSESEFAPSFASQSFIPNVFVDISEFFAKKCEIMEIALNTPNLTLSQESVESLIYEKDSQGRFIAKGVKTNIGKTYYAKAVILTTGTFLRGLVHIGENKIQNGRFGEMSPQNLSTSLQELGLSLGRLKTGTCARIDDALTLLVGLKANPLSF